MVQVENTYNILVVRSGIAREFWYDKQINQTLHYLNDLTKLDVRKIKPPKLLGISFLETERGRDKKEIG